MKKINRRQFLQIAALAGAGTSLAVFPFLRNTHAAEIQVYIVTETPGRDIALVKQQMKFRETKFQVKTAPISSTPQDLTIIYDGQVVDPLGEECRHPVLQRFTQELRNRQNTGHFLVTISAPEPRELNQVTFEVNGKVIDQVDLSREYRSIIIPGYQGETEFKLAGGEVSVVHSSCRNQICQHMGNIKAGRILCAPNKLIARVGHSDSNSAVDSVTG